METVLFAINAIGPIVLLILFGIFLRKRGLFEEGFLNRANRLTFRAFLPLLLFYNVYNIKSFSDIEWDFILYVLLFLVVIFLVGIPLVRVLCKEPRQRGVQLQVAFRSNFALIGIPLATMLFGDEGAAYASVLSAFTIPLFNILAVLALSIFGDGKEKVNWKKILLDMAKNPLIWGVVCGFLALLVRALLQKVQVAFRLTDIPFLYKAIENVAKMATPFALIVLGGRFKVEAVKRLWKPIVAGTVVRTVVVPTLALGIAYILFPHFGGQHFAAYIAAFGSPAAVSSAIMAKEMGGDDELAGQLVVWTTVFSALTVFLQIVILRKVGIF